MFSKFDRLSPLVYSFRASDEFIRQLFRQNIVGGLVNVFTRYMICGSSDGPLAAKTTANGDTITKISFFDFNAL